MTKITHTTKWKLSSPSSCYPYPDHSFHAEVLTNSRIQQNILLRYSNQYSILMHMIILWKYYHNTSYCSSFDLSRICSWKLNDRGRSKGSSSSHKIKTHAHHHQPSTMNWLVETFFKSLTGEAVIKRWMTRKFQTRPDTRHPPLQANGHWSRGQWEAINAFGQRRP